VTSGWIEPASFGSEFLCAPSCFRRRTLAYLFKVSRDKVGPNFYALVKMQSHNGQRQCRHRRLRRRCCW
jgi:hypothetical protein